MSEPRETSSAEYPEAVLAAARARLGDRGLDPNQVLGPNAFGQEIDVATFYLNLGTIAATEKAGQSPTYAAARLALRAGLPNEVAETLFLAYNQQSAEEAGHGDKVFGNAYFVLGGASPSADQSVVGNPEGAASLIAISDDAKENKKRLGAFAAVLGGIETVALQRAFPSVVNLCERWQHPVARDLLQQIRDVVRPEESRHVLLFRYAFHQLIVGKSEAVLTGFHELFNAGRAQVGGEALDRAEFVRLVGASAPSPRQLLGKDRALAS